MFIIDGATKNKKGKLLVSHRYDYLPLLPSEPGGIWQELVVQDLPERKSTLIFKNTKINVTFFKIFFKHANNR